MKIRLERDDILEACRVYINEKFDAGYEIGDLVLYIEDNDGIVEGCDPSIEVEIEQ